MTMTAYTVPDDYTPILDVPETQNAIKLVKDFFEMSLAEALNLRRITAPLFVLAGSGINDDLNGIERPVSFDVPDLGDGSVEIVQSLAKWKRLALAELGFGFGDGIYTDMNAIRRDEALDELHSAYVDQWDWERVMRAEDRNLEFLRRMVRKIYRALRRTELHVFERYPELGSGLPDDITFVHAEELAARFPRLTPREREDEIAHEHGAVFVIGIGAPIDGGEPHDGRAPDYDDWITPNGQGRGLNGDILVWHPALQRSFELSSMGIRVVPESLRAQLELRGCLEKSNLYFQRRLLAGELPCSVGGGIGQSRLCMFLLRKAHIGEVQVSVWPEAMRRVWREARIPLL